MARGETDGRGDDVVIGVPFDKTDGFSFTITLPTQHATQGDLGSGPIKIPLSSNL